MADDRSDSDDAPPTPAHHVPEAGARQAKTRGQVDIQHLLPILVAEAHGNGVPGEAGVVHQDIDLTQSGLGIGHQLVRACWIGEVGRQHQTALIEPLGQRLQRRQLGASQRNRSPLGMERGGDGAPDTAGGAGHQRLLAAQIEHAHLPS